MSTKPQRTGPLAPGVAFITGGARGLGNAIAVSFAKEGARGVVLVDIQDEETFAVGKKAVEEYGVKCLTIRADVTREPDVERAVAQAIKEFGRLDYAANFAGVIGPSEHIRDISLADWEKAMAVNSTGVFLCTKHELRAMQGQESTEVEPGRVAQRGSIVNCASVNSLQTMAGGGAYTATKHAVAGLTKAAALEARQYGIRVNAVSPGFLRTPMIMNAIIKGGWGLSETPAENPGEQLWSTFEARQGRIAAFAEVGDVVVLLSTPRMSLVNGHNLFIDNGFTVNESNF